MADKNVSFSIKAQNKTAKTFRAIKSSVGSLNKSVLGLGAAIAGAAGLGAFGVMAKGAMTVGDRIHKLNLRIGASTEALSQYRHVANMSGVSFEEFTKGLEKMSRNVSEAAGGTGIAVDALEELGLSAESLREMKPEAQFETLADAIAAVENPTDKTRLAMDIFGKSGGALIQIMAGGSEGIQAMRKEADALGMTMSGKTATGIATANDSIQKVVSRITSMVELLMGELSPTLSDIADNVGAWIDQNRGLISQNMTTVISALVDTGKVLIPVFSFIADVFEIVGKAIGWVSFKIYEVMEAFNTFEGIAKSWNWIKESFGMGDGGDTAAQAAAPSGAAAVAAAGGGSGFTGSDAADWAFGSESGTTVNINTQVTRSDAVAIVAEANRTGTRQ